jgi:putative flippase GtrA
MQPVSPKNLFARGRALLFDRALFRKAVSFAGVGVVNTLVDFSLFSLFHLYLGWRIVVANVASWGVAVTGSYVMNSLFTFAAESQGKLRIKAYASFVVAQLAGLFANTATVVIASYFVPVLVGKILAIGVTFAVNFSLSHFVIFRAQRPKPQ